MLTEWIRVAGRLHPLVLHLPIGLLAGLVVLEVMSLRRPEMAWRRATGAMAWVAAIAAVVAAGTGYLLSLEAGYDEGTLDLHMWLGIGVAAGALVVAVLNETTRRWWRGLIAYRFGLVLVLAALVPAGHFGNILTRGDGFLTEPLRAGREEGGGTADPGVTVMATKFSGLIAPIFESNCTACHGTKKRKGGLSLATASGISAGGEVGPVIVPGDPANSEMVRRLRLPIDDDDHMPPEGKRQPTEDEIRRLEEWIAAGAPFDEATSGALAEGSAPSSPPPPPSPSNSPAAILAADPESIDRLRQALVHVQPVAADSNLLWIDFAAAAKQMTDPQVASLLEPVATQVADLSLAACDIAEKTLGLLARMPNLRRLDLRATPTTDDTLGALDGHATLEELVLAQTHLTDAAADQLLSLPALRSVLLWRSGLSETGIARLRTARPDLKLISGDEPDAAVLDSEQEIKLTSETPLVGAGGAGADDKTAAVPAPINTVCPVSGSAVDPNYQVVFRGRVVGFCCPNCPGKFWTEPEKYLAKLPP